MMQKKTTSKKDLRIYYSNSKVQSPNAWNNDFFFSLLLIFNVKKMKIWQD